MLQTDMKEQNCQKKVLKKKSNPIIFIPVGRTKQDVYRHLLGQTETGFLTVYVNVLLKI